MAKDAFIDFAAIREELSIEQTASYLGLRLPNKDQVSIDCPACDSENALKIKKSEKKYYCFHDERGGDLIGLIAHVKGIGQRDAAKLVMRDLLGNNTETVQKPRRGQQYSNSKRREPPGEQQERQNDSPPAGIEPLDCLDATHEDVEALGITAEDAQALGAGYASKGVLRGLVAFPLRTEEGALVAYVGVAEGRVGKIHWPDQKVVPFTKKRA